MTEDFTAADKVVVHRGIPIEMESIVFVTCENHFRGVFHVAAAVP